MIGVTLRVRAPVLSGRAHWAHCQPHLRDTLARAGGVVAGIWLLSPPGWGLGSAAGTLSTAQEPGSGTGEEPGQGLWGGGRWALGPVWRRIGRPPGRWPVSGPKVTQRKP